MIYLNNVNMVTVPANQHLLSGMMFMTYLWTKSSNINKIRKWGWYIVIVAIWAYGNPEIHFFNKVVA